MELVQLQCSDELKSKFYAAGVLLLDFYKKYLECKQCSNLINHAKKDGINVWQHLCIQTVVFVYKSHEEQVKNTT